MPLSGRVCEGERESDKGRKGILLLGPADSLLSVLSASSPDYQ